MGVRMNEKEFQAAIRRAKMWQKLQPERADYFVGLQRGLRRLYHGENFGTDDEHTKWLSLATDSTRRMMGIGYRVGLHHGRLPGPEDVQGLRRMLGWSVSDMAEWCGVSPRTVEGWEQGRPVSEPAAQRIREILTT